MFKAARIAKIREVILDRGQVDVNTLSALLNVSDVTIRSDLEQLELEKFIYRTHGGAVLNEDYVRQSQNAQSAMPGLVEYDKNREYIGNIAADMVEENKWIFLGQGTTCYYIARALVSKPRLRVVTNSMLVGTVLSQNKSSQIILTGGNLMHDHMYLYGEGFLQSLENIYFSKAFIGVAGIDFHGGITVADAPEQFICAKIREISSQLIIAADYKKFGATDFMRIGGLHFADVIISNEKIPEEYKSWFFDNGVTLFTSYRIKPSSVSGGE